MYAVLLMCSAIKGVYMSHFYLFTGINKRGKSIEQGEASVVYIHKCRIVAR